MQPFSTIRGVLNDFIFKLPGKVVVFETLLNTLLDRFRVERFNFLLGEQQF